MPARARGDGVEGARAEEEREGEAEEEARVAGREERVEGQLDPGVSLGAGEMGLGAAGRAGLVKVVRGRVARGWEGQETEATERRKAAEGLVVVAKAVWGRVGRGLGDKAS